MIYRFSLRTPQRVIIPQRSASEPKADIYVMKFGRNKYAVGSIVSNEI